MTSGAGGVRRRRGRGFRPLRTASQYAAAFARFARVLANDRARPPLRLNAV